VATKFNAVAYPNPFANNFMINVSTTTKENVSIKVYDMVGRMIDQHNTAATQLELLPLGNHYPSGVYNVVVSQGEDVKTLRIVKR
jgi:hypothetical protein